MSERWDFYFTRVNDVLASVFVDLGIRSSVPLSSKRQLLWIWVYFNRPRKDGLSSAEEFPLLKEIEDALCKALTRKMSAVAVGRITTSGRREFYFYAPVSEGLDKLAARTMSQFQDYRFDCGSQHDPAWNQYLDVLYPSGENMQRIWNRGVVEALEREGDQPDVPRPVEHWIYFKTESARSSYAEKARALGFDVKENWLDAQRDSERPFAIRLSRDERMHLNAIDEVTLSLWRLAKDFGGDYDGWETQVMRS
jgi:regulator of RNase E activity RraB